MHAGELLEQLLDWTDAPCVSVLIPHLRSDKEISAGIRQALDQAERELVAGFGLSPQQAAGEVAPLRSVPLHPADWQQATAVVMFCRRGEIRRGVIPFDGSDHTVRVVTLAVPYVLWLVDAQQHDVEHLLIGLNRRRPRLLHCDAGRWTPIEVALPDESDLVMSKQRGRSDHGSPSNGRVSSSSSSGDRLDKALLAEFMRQLERAAHSAGVADELPAVVVGPTYEIAAFAEISGRETRRVACGSIDHMSDDDLVATARPAARDLAGARTAAAEQRLDAAAGAGRRISTSADVRETALHGLVAELFVPSRYLRATSLEAVTVGAATLLTLRHHGTVHVVEDEAATTVEAVTRWR
jgi:hypothetical protein